MDFTFIKGLRSGDRTPVLWIAHNGKIHNFTGSNIPSVCVVESSHSSKNGKWSSTMYHLTLAKGAVACELLAPLHGQVWPENARFLAYERFINGHKVSLSFDAFDEALARDFPEARERMLAGEEALAALEEGDDAEAELREISTSAPSRDADLKDIKVSHNGQTWVVAHEAPVGVEVVGVFRLVDVKKTPGFRGGWKTLTFALAYGAELSLGYGDDTALGRGGVTKQEEENETDNAMAEALRRAGLI